MYDLLIDNHHWDVDSVISHALYKESLENSNIVHNNPSYVNQQISEALLKRWALENVFPPDVAKAHEEGLIHIHDLGHPFRMYCSSHSLDLIKKYGLDLITLSTRSGPPKHLISLIGQLNTFLSVIQAYFAGALGIGYMDIFMAPYVDELNDSELYQTIQYLWYSASQNAYSRSAQTLFQDFNFHGTIPPVLRDVIAIGPGGREIGKYGNYEKQARRLTLTALEIIKQGDVDGRPFAFPKFNYHVVKECFTNSRVRDVFLKACEVASHNGSVYFLFDRNNTQLAACCRLKWNVPYEFFQRTTLLRFVGFQNVTINLPGIILRYKDWVEGLTYAVKLACKAHRAKLAFINSLRDTVLREMFRQHPDGEPYVNLSKRATYIIGCVGLAEAVELLSGHKLETEEGQLCGLKTISILYMLCKKYQNGLKLVMEESPAESAATRLAMVDMQEFPEARRVLAIDDPPTYTNSIHIKPDSDIDVITRCILQSRYHWMFDAGAIIHLWVGEKNPSPKSLARLIERIYYNTNCAQIVVSPDFTDCRECNTIIKGHHERCVNCHSRNVEHLARIVGYYSRVSRWHKGKQVEYKIRRRVSI